MMHGLVAGVLALVVSVLPTVVHAGQNITVDDTDLTVVTYNPGSAASPGWNPEPGCTTCSLMPDASLAYNNTWHDDLWEPAGSDGHGGLLWVEMTFHGVAVYVFNIIPNNQANAQTNLSFVLDGDNSTRQTYTHTPDPTSSQTFLYNTTVYNATNLSNTTHTLQMSMIGTNQDLAALFDYFIYTTADDKSESTSDSSTTHSSDAKVIAPAVVCSIVGVAIIGGVLFFFFREKRRGSSPVSVSQYPMRQSAIDIASTMETGGAGVGPHDVHSGPWSAGGGQANSTWTGSTAALPLQSQITAISHTAGPSIDGVSILSPGTDVQSPAYSYAPSASTEKARLRDAYAQAQAQVQGSTDELRPLPVRSATAVSGTAMSATSESAGLLSPASTLAPGVSREEVGALWAELQRVREQQQAQQDMLTSLPPLPSYEDDIHE